MSDWISCSKVSAKVSSLGLVLAAVWLTHALLTFGGCRCFPRGSGKDLVRLSFASKGGFFHLLEKRTCPGSLTIPVASVIPAVLQLTCDEFWSSLFFRRMVGLVGPVLGEDHVLNQPNSLFGLLVYFMVFAGCKFPFPFCLLRLAVLKRV